MIDIWEKESESLLSSQTGTLFLVECHTNQSLSRAQRSLAKTLSNFQFECIGSSLTDDEIVIAGSFKEFGRLLSMIEDERDRMLERAQTTIIDPIERFRKEKIGGAKEGKKKFDKETAKFCQIQERHLNLSTKKNENQLQEADASLQMAQRDFCRASLEYVFQLQEVQERKKFEFVEIILSFMYGWLTFYHQGHEVAKDFKSFMTDLQIRLQRTRDNYDATTCETSQLKLRMLEKYQDPGSLNKMYTRQGYLFLMEKKALGTTWNKQFCQYQKGNRKFTMIPYSQTTGKISTTDTLIVKECTRRMSESIDKRFCFDVVPQDRPSSLTYQALSEEDRRLWLDAMDGKEPTYSQLGKVTKQEDYILDEVGFSFVKKCIEVVEKRGLQDQGIYRVVGVNSKVVRLSKLALDKKRSGNINLDDPEEWEVKTITSALKNYFRNLTEPLMTYKLHNLFINAAKQENKGQRVNDIHLLVYNLPKTNKDMLELLISHLYRVAQHSDKNLMTVSNLGVCFGPTLLRPEEETVASIMDIKFGNIVVEILIENCDKIFGSVLDSVELRKKEISSRSPASHVNHYGSSTSNAEPEVRQGSRGTLTNTDSSRSPVVPVSSVPSSMHHPSLRPAVPPSYFEAVNSAYNETCLHIPLCQSNITNKSWSSTDLSKCRWTAPRWSST
ncbi:rho GTPase-activating protein 26-like isoform X2 [Tachypleus tridentatus]|uniref:rho GTPase-activating protein 26-like isoform X2 n=1 Tax=Tachypleus tridentatus TaxID=6853 RepID=UPI003FD5B415